MMSVGRGARGNTRRNLRSDDDRSFDEEEEVDEGGGTSEEETPIQHAGTGRSSRGESQGSVGGRSRATTASSGSTRVSGNKRRGSDDMEQRKEKCQHLNDECKPYRML